MNRSPHHHHRPGPRKWSRAVVCVLAVAVALVGSAQDAQLRAKADALFAKGEYAEALPLYSQLVSLSAQDHDLNFKYGACSVRGGGDKEKAISYLKFAVQGPNTSPLAWYFLGEADHLTYHFKDALAAYERYKGTADKKMLAAFPVDVLEAQCRNGQQLLNNLKDIEVKNKTEVSASDFFRFYDLGDIGGKIVTLPEELMSSLDRKSKERSLVYLPDKGGPIYFSSYGKDGRTGRDIYRTELVGASFSAPVKVAGYVNTDRDEDFAVMAPDGRSFYFCSKGHNSMGGYDVFRTTYDKGNDVFGPPENMDFAVNTPDDELMYIVDAEGKQACFASGRDSKEGMLHVYRVGTAQTPVNITVLRGTFASQFDEKDRKAHIVVEDALTREIVCDVRTDMNGEYVLALPRNGRYKFTVKGGPGERTHAGMVEIPRSDRSKAYRQEMSLIDQGGPKLMIKNYFDEALEEDVMALALDEIKRRARLDITGERPAITEPVVDLSRADLMTQAGFTGDLTVADAARLAKEDEQETAARTADLQESSEAAMVIAQENLAEAAAAAAKAKELVAQATATDDEAAMTEAARERERARAALVRARAAQQAGQELEAERLASEQRSIAAAKLKADLERATATKDKEANLEALKRLKARMDAKSGPNAEPDAKEKARRAAVAAERELAKMVERTREAREEGSQLNDRIRRLEQQEQEAKGRKKEELAAEVATLKEQHAALEDETRKAVAKMTVTERNTRIVQGRAVLTEVLERHEQAPPTPLPIEEKTTLVTRIGAVESNVAGIAIDERYEALIAEEMRTTQQQLFDRFTGGATLAAATPLKPRTPTEQAPIQTGTSGTEPATEPPATEPVAAEPQPRNDPPPTRSEEPPATTQQPVVKEEPTVEPPRTEGTEPVVTPPVLTQEPVAVERTTPPTENGEELTPEDLAFIQANELAELHQARAAARNKQEKDSLDAAIKAAQERMRATAANKEPEPQQTPVEESTVEEVEEEVPAPMADDRAALVFDPKEQDDALLAKLYLALVADRERIVGGIVDAQERAQGLQGLELMAVDSIDAEIARQQVAVAKDPSAAPLTAQRIERLEALKQTRQQAAERVWDAVPLSDAAFTEPEGPTRTDDYVSPARDPEEIYSSVVDLRTTGAKEAIVDRDRDLERLVELEDRIDSLEQRWEGLSAGRERDKVRNQADRAIDDHLVLRSEIGQRQGFIMKEELRTMRDSATALETQVAAKGIGAEDHTVRMAEHSDEEARTHSNAAAALRKQAERTEDIVKRDSLYRSAYAQDLQALRALDRTLTARNHILSAHHRVGATPTYARIEEDLFGKPAEAPLAGSEQPSLSEQPRPDPVPEVTPNTPEINEPVAISTPPPSEPSAPVIGEEVPPLVQRETPVAAPMAQPAAAPRTTAVAGTAEEARSRALQLEQRSLVAAGSAFAAQDSATKAEGAEQVRLTRNAERHRALSDSLHRAAEELNAQAVVLERSTGGDGRVALADRLHRFYYLSNEDHRVVMDDEDLSEYFGIRLQALEQRERAGTIRQEAEGQRQAARALEAEPMDTRDPQALAARRMEVRRLDRSADSLSTAADRLLGLAQASELQADGMRSKMPAPRAEKATAVEEHLRASTPAVREVPSATLQSPPREQVPEPKVTAPQEAAAVAPAAAPAPARPNERPPVTPPPTESTVEAAPVTPPERTVEPPPMTRLEVPSAHEEEEVPVPTGLLAPLQADVFNMGAGVARRTGAIPIDAPMPSGVVFKVQVGALRNKPSDDAFGDLTPVAGERTSGGLVRYTAGMFTSPEAAIEAVKQVRGNGYRDAFVVAYQDGKRVNLETARQALRGTPVQREATAAAVPVPATVPVQQPPTQQPTTTQPDEQQVLVNYPTNAEEVLAQFKPAADATAYYNDPNAAPALQVETVKGLFFTVQVGVYSKPTALDRLFNITPLNSERTETGKIRYTTGVYLDMPSVRSRREQAVGLGVKDAFITAYLNGKRIPMRDAQALLERFGPSILAVPQPAR
ncbi:MAG TPA: hypothetical protein VGE21_12950 [Flavobacteriales bacterium]